MRFHWEYLVAGAAAILVLMLTWFAGPIFHVVGTNALVLRAGILLLGVIAIIGLLLWARSARPPMPEVGSPSVPTPQFSAPGGMSVSMAGGAGTSGSSQDIDLLVREASTKVASARLAAGAQLYSLPTVFLLGETGGGKTSAMDQSGLDAELLAGQVFQESSIVPTRVANIWFARKTVFVEAGGPLMDDAGSWVRLVKHFIPGSLRSVFGGGSSAPRAAVVCVDCEKLVREAALDKIVAQARKVRSRLEELSYHMGVSLPVYVLFNRSDRVPYFEEFAGTFSDQETSQVLGATLPLTGATSSGVYAEQETKRLTAAFQAIFFNLAECRPGLLGRERNSDRQAGIYEFPREFGKLSKPLVQFLVDLCRPGHLRTGPFLRGFYFVGQRVVTVSGGGGAAGTMLGTQSAMQKAPGGFNPAATSLLSAQDASAKSSWSTGTSIGAGMESHRSIQRVFLSHVFSHVLLQDRAALGASGTSSRGDFGRRILFASLAALCFIWIIITAVSFAGNQRLISQIRAAGQDLSAVQNTGALPPTTDSLRRLDNLRKALLELREDDQNTPLHLRWGLYAGGDPLTPDARAIYFHAFDQVLLQHTKQNLLADLRTYRGVPQADADSNAPYNSLKAYLLTTSEYQRNSATGEFLQDFLMKDWKRDFADLDQDRTELAAQQFAFYSSELSQDNPFSKINDTLLVDQVRAYLNGFSGVQRLYTSMLNDARQKAKSYRFAASHPDGLAAMHGGTDVDAPFTADGWKVMDQSIQNPKNVQGETWVLGSAASSNLSTSELSSQLRALYEKDFITQWRAFLNTSSVLGYHDDADAAGKLRKLSSNSSPLLELVCDVSENTFVASDNIKKAFSAPQQVVAHGCNSQQIYLQQANNAYMKGLFDLQTCVQDIADAPQDQKDAKKQACVQTAKQSLLIAGQLEQVLPADPEGKVDQRVSALLEAPIKPYAAATVASDAGKLCGAFKSLQTAYPFNAHSNRDITLDEFNLVFQPVTGALSLFIIDHKSILSLQSNGYVRALGSNVPGPITLRTINQLYAIQQAVYPNGAKDPHFEYSVTAHLPDAGGFKSEKLSFDGQEWTITATSGTKKFIWPGPVARGATLSLNSGGSDLDVAHYDGLWAVSHFLSGYRWQASPTGYIIQGPLIGPTGQPIMSNGKAIEVRFDVDFKGVQFFQAGYLAGYGCPLKLNQ